MGMLFNQGQDLMLQAIINKTPGQDLVLRLYKNNHTPVAADTEANFTEADFTGYSAKNLTGANWSTSGGSPVTAAYAQQAFIASANQAPQSVYGWYITQVTSGKALGGDVFRDGQGNPIVRTVSNINDEITFTPSWTQNHT